MNNNLNRFVEAYFNFFTNYFNFRDKTSRFDYAVPTVINAIIYAFIYYADNKAFVLLLSVLYVLALLIPSIAISVRRIRDIGLHVAWIILIFVPIISFFFSIYLLFAPGTQTEDMKEIKKDLQDFTDINK